MTSKEVIEAVAEWYDIDPDDETGEYDLDSYDWTAGCNFDGHWMCLKDVVGCIEHMLKQNGLLD